MTTKLMRQHEMEFVRHRGLMSAANRIWSAMLMLLVVTLQAGCGQQKDLVETADTDASAAVNSDDAQVASQQESPSGPFRSVSMSSAADASQPFRNDSDIRFVESAARCGLIFQHESGQSTNYYFPEMVGSGVALLDFDHDGDLDVYFAQGHKWAAATDGAIVSSDEISRDRLFRNDMVPGDPESLRFTDVTESSGIEAAGYGMGVSTGDFNNDGYVDLYVTNFGSNQLWINNCDSTFRNGTDEWKADDDRWSTSAATIDFDRDGWLDLFICNYVAFSFGSHKKCFDSSTVRDYCGPLSYPPQPDRILRNCGDGSFEDLTAEAGVGSTFGAGLGVACADYNGDGWPDIYVANDGLPNQCWVNRRDGTFEDISLLAGCAFNEMGKAEAGMGVDAADFDDDGDDDLFLAHLSGETNTVYLNENGIFEDSTDQLHLAGPSRAMTAFGASWLDMDLDGDLDVFTVNGAVTRGVTSSGSSELYPPGQPNQIFRNDGELRFSDVSRSMPDAFNGAFRGRGAAVGDIDNDGDPDMIVSNNHGPAHLFLNATNRRGPWLGLKLVTGPNGRDAHGAVVTMTLPDGRTLRRHVHTDGSYCSSRDPRILLGLGASASFSQLTVQWPDGQSEHFDPSLDAYTVLSQGTGQQVEQ